MTFNHLVYGLTKLLKCWVEISAEKYKKKKKNRNIPNSLSSYHSFIFLILCISFIVGRCKACCISLPRFCFSLLIRNKFSFVGLYTRWSEGATVEDIKYLRESRSSCRKFYFTNVYYFINSSRETELILREKIDVFPLPLKFILKYFALFLPLELFLGSYTPLDRKLYNRTTTTSKCANMLDKWQLFEEWNL